MSLSRLAVLLLLLAMPAFARHARADGDATAYTQVETWASQPADVFEPLPWPREHVPGGIGLGGADGQLAVVDRTDDTIRVYDRGQVTVVLGGRGGAAGSFRDAYDVDVLPDGALAVSDAGNDRVQILAPTGEPLAEWSVAAPRGLEAVRDWVYVVSEAERRVLAFDRNGQVQRTIDLAGQTVAPGGLSYRGDLDGRSEPPDAMFSVADPDLGRLYAVHDGAQKALRILSGLPGLRAGTQWRDGASHYWLAAVPGPGGGLIVSDAGHNVVSSVSFEGIHDLELGADGVVFAAVTPHGPVRIPDLHAVLGQATNTFGRLIEPRTISVGEATLIGDGAPRVQVWSRDGVPLRDVSFLPGGAPGGGGADPTLPDEDASPPTDVAASGPHQFVLWPTGRIRRLDGDAFTHTWDPPTPSGHWITAISASGGRVAALDLAGQQVLLFDERLNPVDAWPVSTDTFLGGTDLALAGDRVYLIDRSAHTLEARSLDGDVMGTFPLISRPERIAAGPDGSAFVLTGAGWVTVIGAGGEARGSWPIGTSGQRPTDITLDAEARLYVTDASGVVRVYAPDDGATTGVPGSSGDGDCGAIAYKAAQPQVITIGETVEVQLVVDGACPRDETIADVVLVIDSSGSMTGAKIRAAKAAAVDFVLNLYGARSRLGVVTFSSGAEQVRPLSEDRTQAVRGIAGLSAGGTTNVVDGLGEALRTMRAAPPSPDAKQVIVFLSDGRHSVSTPLNWLDDLIDAVREDGILLFAVGLGEDADRLTLGRMATDPSYYYDSPTEDELAGIYAQIAGRIGASELFRMATVTDVVPGNMTYVRGSGEPWEPIYDDVTRTLVWELRGVMEPGFRLSYRLRPEQGGLWPTNVQAEAQYFDGLDRFGRLPFPVPYVRVLVPHPTPTPTDTPPPTPTPTVTPTPTDTPTPTPTPTDTPTPTPTNTPTPTPTVTLTPTPLPAPIYLPMARVDRCRMRKSGVDMVLVIDSSSSMAARTRPDGPTKLEAAVAAAHDLVDLMGFPTDRVAVVQFNDVASVITPMTDERSGAHDALAQVWMQVGTRIDVGVTAAHEVIEASSARPGNRPVVVLLTDGRPTRSRASLAILAAERLKRAGVALYTVGLGPDVDPDLLLMMASTVGTYFYAPGTDDLAQIYRGIAEQIVCE